jgi:hypothetical protein
LSRDSKEITTKIRHYCCYPRWNGERASPEMCDPTSSMSHSFKVTWHSFSAYWIWASHSGSYEELYFLGCEAVWFVEIQPTFQRTMSPISSMLNSKPSKKLAWRRQQKKLCFTCFYETSVSFQRTTRRYVPDDRNPLSGRRGESWLYRDPNSDPSVVQPVTSRYTDCANEKNFFFRTERNTQMHSVDIMYE